ncbi:transcriptional repressor [Candidatus Uhrbacteria bacterium]|nr:transcriptional repressor [Candidatus Uhrbacteria bacterium]
MKLANVRQIDFREVYWRGRLKRTPARILILQILRISQKTLSIKEIYSIIKVRLNKVSLVTVYRNLNSLIKAGRLYRMSLSRIEPRTPKN